VLIASSELEEILGVADRVVVLSEGHLVGEVHRDTGAFTTETILRMAFRAQEAAA
jgi:ribose transport system ATP-binding protein